MKKTINIFGFSFLMAILFAVFPGLSLATSGCCSWHGGVSHCDTSTGRQVCSDGTYSPSCGCTYIPPTPKPTVQKLTPVASTKSAVDTLVDDSIAQNPPYKQPSAITKNDIMDLQADISTLKTQNDDLTKKNTDLQTQIDNAPSLNASQSDDSFAGGLATGAIGVGALSLLIRNVNKKNQKKTNESI